MIINGISHLLYWLSVFMTSHTCRIRVQKASMWAIIVSSSVIDTPGPSSPITDTARLTGDMLVDVLVPCLLIEPLDRLSHRRQKMVNDY